MADDVTAGAPIRSITSDQDLPVWSCAFSFDGSLLAMASGTAESGIVDVFDPSTGKMLIGLAKHSSFVNSIGAHCAPACRY